MVNIDDIKIDGFEINTNRVMFGGSGLVYEAVEKTTGRKCAYKVMKITHTAINKYKDKDRKLISANNEISLMRRFRRKHRNLLDLVTAELQEQDGNRTNFIIVTPMCDLGDLNEYTQTHLLNVINHVDILHQCACGISYLHGEGILHRDVKPGNFLMLLQGGHHVVKTCDFGLSREYLGYESTVAMTGSGTIAYMGPEFFHRNGRLKLEMGEQVQYHQNGYQDSFGLGVTGYNLINSKPALNGTRNEEEEKRASISRLGSH